MKRLLMTASAVATLAIPALAMAHQDQNNRPERPAPAQNRPAVAHPGPVARPGIAPAMHDNRPGFAQQRFNPATRVVQRPAWNRGNPNWWRGRAEFAGYRGQRPGFWYRPGFGYFRVDPRWYGFSWRVGGFVPAEFRSYYVQNPYEFGLPPVPYGCAYVYLNNQIALMSLATGQIIQIFPGGY